jgi:alkylation response protein AidB-like acyl-CoA dehydrogenase
MSVEWDAQLRMIGESAAVFSAAQGGVAHARRVHGGAPVWDASLWKAIAELGWLGIAVSEARGGLALGAPAAAVVAEQAGRALMMAPIGMGMASAQVLADGPGGGDETLPALLAGDACVALADAAAQADDTVTAALIPDGDAAGQWLLAVGEGSVFGVRCVHRGSPGVRHSTRVAVDGSRLVDVAVEHGAWADAPLVLSGASGEAAWQRGVQLGWLADAAYLCGLMDAALQLALGYMRLRRQFGVPIGSFQALQHRATACHVDVTATRALLHESARAFGTPNEAWAAAASAHRAAEAALRVTKEVVQFHGAVGFADEHDAGLYLRRAMTVGARFGSRAGTCLRRGRIVRGDP